jgi:hypothetical protein
MLYITVAILTVFTSNDIIILSFTPFVCYFAKNAHIDPMPYLAAEFIAANTWSMALIIGNPTNIYLVTATGGDFVSYAKVMLIPTLVAGVVSAKPVESRIIIGLKTKLLLVLNVAYHIKQVLYLAYLFLIAHYSIHAIVLFGHFHVILINHIISLPRKLSLP